MKNVNTEGFSKKFIKNTLKTKVCEITFNKVNGEQRKMKCTLKESVLPAIKSQTESKRADNPNIVNVWDIESKDWRSFRIDSVIEMRLVEG